jgi:3-hydroxyacyl-[acyl-carrier-protein] dehydratase
MIFGEMLVDKNDIERFIPQRRPMIMVDSLLSASESSAISQLTIDAENIFSSSGFLDEAGLIENIAQTAALHAGYNYQLLNKPVPLGFIAAIRNLEIFDLPAKGTIIQTALTIVNNVMNITIADGLIMQSEKKICRCEIRIFIQP